MKFAKILRTLSHYLEHPLGRRDRLGTLLRILRWQVGSRLLQSPVAIPFVNGTRLLVRTGQHGATGNVYVGLMEFEDMAFVLHFLRAEDVFVDVGANVGVFSILAASRGAQVSALEPVPSTFEQLMDNIHLNRFDEQIRPSNIGVGGAEGGLRFSTRTGPTNHVLASDEQDDEAVFIDVRPMDAIVKQATMLKIDVEGFEAEVVRGAGKLLRDENLRAVLIELNGLGARYGFGDDATHVQLLEFGFSPVHYEPWTRRLMELDQHNASGNTLYVRRSDDMDFRLREARPIEWGGYRI